MWSAVPVSPGCSTPPSRSKHSATLLGSYVYVLGGRNGNLPLKDLWRYSLGKSSLYVYFLLETALILYLDEFQFSFILNYSTEVNYTRK